MMRMDGDGRGWGDRPVELVQQELTRQVIGAAMAVHTALGPGFLEKVYENALAIELRSSGLVVEQQMPVTVRYRDQVVGEYLADLLVAETLLIELKVADQLVEAHSAQVLNYLRATGLSVGLLFNFGGPRLEWKRFANTRPSSANIGGSPRSSASNTRKEADEN